MLRILRKEVFPTSMIRETLELKEQILRFEYVPD
jgi:hypothetical protein